jgi:hypothetical protein
VNPPRLPISLVMSCGILLLPGIGLAHDLDGRFGLGFEETLTGLGPGLADASVPAIDASGLALHAFYANWGFEAITGGSLVLPSQGDAPWAAFLALGAHYQAFRAPFVNLSAGIRVVGGLSRPVDAAGHARGLASGLTLEGPLRALFLLSPVFGVSAAVGPVLSINGKRANPLTGGVDSLDFSLFRGGFSGGLGFVVFVR